MFLFHTVAGYLQIYSPWFHSSLLTDSLIKLCTLDISAKKEQLSKTTVTAHYDCSKRRTKAEKASGKAPECSVYRCWTETLTIARIICLCYK